MARRDVASNHRLRWIQVTHSSAADVAMMMNAISTERSVRDAPRREGAGGDAETADSRFSGIALHQRDVENSAAMALSLLPGPGWRGTVCARAARTRPTGPPPAPARPAPAPSGTGWCQHEEAHAHHRVTQAHAQRRADHGLHPGSCQPTAAWTSPLCVVSAPGFGPSI
jgi:hypothetical protein